MVPIYSEAYSNNMNIQAMMAQAKKMQAEMEKKQQEIAKKEFVVEKQGIKVTVMGDRKVKSVEINEILIDPEDKEILEDMVVIAMNEALAMIDEANAEAAPSVPNMPF